MRLTNRTRQLTASPIAEAHAWLAHRTSDRPLLDLSQAAPSYPTAPEIAARIAEVASEPDGGRYAPPPGLPHLNQAMADELSADYVAQIAADNILPTSGCNQAFCVTTSALTEPGDEVIIAVPYYFNHDMWLKLDGVIPRYLTPVDDPVTTGPQALIPDPSRAEQLINDRTRAIVLVTPGNPTGVTIPPDTIGAFAQLARANGLALIVDETYRNFRLTTDRPHDLFDDPGWADTVIILHSFSKDLAIPGYRVGAIVAGPEIIYEIMKLVDCVQISAPRIGQEAAVAGLRHARGWRTEQAARINQALGRFTEVMAARPGGFELASAGAFFGWVRHPFNDLGTDEVIKRLVLDHDVLAIPGTAFTPTDERWVRFSYANLDEAQMDELGHRLGEISLGEISS
jgi:aspartate/methionine/tyrosine aminotransferase